MFKNDGSCSAFVQNTPASISKEYLSTQDLLNDIDKLMICSGNPDHHFVEMLKKRKGNAILSKDRKSVMATLDYTRVINSNQFYPVTVRVKTCKMITTEKQCENCKRYRHNLRSLHSKSNKLSKSSSSSTNIRFLTTPERRRKITKLRQDNKCLRRKIDSYKANIEKSKDIVGIAFDDTLTSDFEIIMNQCNKDVMKTHPPNSFHHIFWEQHHNSIKQKDARQIRWHPAMIKWCLSLKLLSSSCYNALRSSGVIKLPSDRTLRDYTNWTKLTTGLSTSVDQQLLIEANLDLLNTIVMFVSSLTNAKSKKTWFMIMRYITDINNHLKSIEKSYDKSTAVTSVQKLATHMLMFMVRGLFSSLKFPYAQFSTN